METPPHYWRGVTGINSWVLSQPPRNSKRSWFLCCGLNSKVNLCHNVASLLCNTATEIHMCVYVIYFNSLDRWKCRSVLKFVIFKDFVMICMSNIFREIDFSAILINYQYLWRHMVSLDHNDLIHLLFVNHRNFEEVIYQHKFFDGAKNTPTLFNWLLVRLHFSL